MNTNITVNPSAAQATATLSAVNLQNQALAAERSGDYVAAEKMYLEAIAVKERTLGKNDPGTALTYNSLGELYLTLKRLDEAETYLTKAVDIRNPKGTVLDAAVSRENLAQLYEARGNLSKAKEIRLSGAPNKMVCAHYQCPGSVFSLNQLKLCSKCKSAFYCSSGCQVTDWKKRHKAFCKAA